jgi:glutamate carboxypeptidase
MIEESRGAAAFLNTEGATGNTAVLTRKGILRYRFNITGKAVHSSRCTRGANAVCEAAHKIIELEKMKDEEGLTCNCGVIEGGTVANTVAEKCSFTADIRFANNEQYEEAVRICKEVAEKSTIEGCSCQLEWVSDRPAMHKSEKNIALLEKMNAIYKECGLPTLTARTAPGGSDAAYTTQAGIPTLDELGVEGNNIHSIKEYARLSSLSESAKRLAAVAYGIE